jgi:hypothetical protein
LAFFGELIGAAFGAVWGGDLFEDFVVEEAFQTVGEDVCWDAFWGGGKIAKAGAAEEKIAND